MPEAATSPETCLPFQGHKGQPGRFRAGWGMGWWGWEQLPGWWKEPVQVSAVRGRRFKTNKSVNPEVQIKNI